MSQYTAQFLEQIYLNLPPLVPESVRFDLEKTLDSLELAPQTTLQVEDITIAFQQKIWPYTQAFNELVQQHLTEMGESLLLRKASYGLRSAYEKYRQAGGTWSQAYLGNNLGDFTSEERVELHQIIVDILCDVRAFARQAAQIADRKLYEGRLAYYRERQEIINRELARLRAFAENEENSELAKEVRQHVRDLELSIASLGPSLNFAAVCQAHEHFVARKKELSVKIVL